MKQRIWRALCLALALCLTGLGAPAWAEEESQLEQAELASGVEESLLEIVETARSSSEDNHRYNIETLSCGEFEVLAGSPDPADDAVVAMLMVWAHGYKSGLEGIDFEARPITLEGMLELTQRAMDECSQHPEILFHVALGRID